MASPIIDKYARAALVAAQEADCLAELERGAACARDALAAVPALRRLTQMRGLEASKRAQALDLALAAADADGITRALAKTMARRRRAALLAPTLDALLAMAALARGVVRIDVALARPLSAERQSRAEAAFAKALGVAPALIDLRPRVDASLVAGARITSRGRVVDASARGRLAAMALPLRQALTEHWRARARI